MKISCTKAFDCQCIFNVMLYYLIGLFWACGLHTYVTIVEPVSKGSAKSYSEGAHKNYHPRNALAKSPPRNTLLK